METERTKYSSVNGAWPDNVPKLTGPEAIIAVRKLYRFIMKRSWQGKIELTSGRRFTWPRRGVMYVNPARSWTGHIQRGWPDVVHLLSHYCHRRLHPGHKPHDGRGTHAWVERQMIEHVVNSGWLDGRLKKPEKPNVDVDVRQVRYQRILKRIDKWTAKACRADHALKKLRAQRNYYERALQIEA
jgi:hypothetical protein